MHPANYVVSTELQISKERYNWVIKMIQDTSSQDILLENKGPKFSPKMVIAGILLFIGFIFFLMQGASNWLASDRSVEKSRLQIATVERGDFIRDVALRGVIVAANSPKLYAPAEGNITLHINPGETVEEGALVATVDSPTLINRLLQEQARLESLGIELERKKINSKQAIIKAKQQIQLEKVVLAAAEREQRRAEQSIKIMAISQIDFEKAVDDLKRSRLKHDFSIEQASLEKESLAFEIKTAEFEYNQYRLLVENTSRLVKALKILAPVSGIVGSWSVEQKSAVVLNQPLLTIVDLSKFQVEVEIPESYADKLGIGMVAKITYNDKTYDAMIATISPEVTNNIVKGRVTFTSEPPPGIKQNQRVTTRVILEKKSNVLFLPRGSFVQHHGGRKAFVVVDEVATLTKISIGSSSINKIEIISGLTEGDRVIVSNTDFVDKSKVLTLN